MRWILFILFCLLGAPAPAVSIPGVTTTTTTDSTTEPAPEPDIEQKKAAYGALADVLDNDTWHCCKVSDEAAFCLIQRPYISKTLLTRRISPRGSP